MELELEGASNFRVVNIFEGFESEIANIFQWKTKINWNRLEIIIVDLSQKKYGKKINWNYLII